MAHAAHQLLASAFDSQRLNLVGHLERFPGYSLVVTGHSLGGSVAVLLTMLLLHHRHVQASSLPAGHRGGVPMHGVPIRCVTFGSAPVYAVHAPLPPGTQEACVTFVNAEDIVARLSLWSFMRLMRLAAAVAEAQPSLLQHWTGSQQQAPVDTIRKALQAASERQRHTAEEASSPQNTSLNTEQRKEDGSEPHSAPHVPYEASESAPPPAAAQAAAGEGASGPSPRDASGDSAPPVTDVGKGTAPTAHQLYVPGTIVYMRGIEHPKATLVESAAEMSRAISTRLSASVGSWLSWGSAGASSAGGTPPAESGESASQDGSRGQRAGLGSTVGAAVQAPFAAAASVFAEAGLQSASAEAKDPDSNSEGGYASDGGDPLSGLTHVTAALLDGPRAATSAAGGTAQGSDRSSAAGSDSVDGSSAASGTSQGEGGGRTAGHVSINGVPQRPPRPDPMRRIPSSDGCDEEVKGPWPLRNHLAFSHVDVRVIHWDQLQDVLPVPGNFTAVHLPNQYRQVVRALQAHEEQVKAERRAVRDGVGGSPLVYGGFREPRSPTSGAAFESRADAKKTPVKRGPSGSAARSCVTVHTHGHEEEWHAVRGVVAGPRSGVIAAEVRRRVGPGRRANSRSPETTPSISCAASRDRAPSDCIGDALPLADEASPAQGGLADSGAAESRLPAGIVAPGKSN